MSWQIVYCGRMHGLQMTDLCFDVLKCRKLSENWFRSVFLLIATVIVAESDKVAAFKMWKFLNVNLEFIEKKMQHWRDRSNKRRRRSHTKWYKIYWRRFLDNCYYAVRFLHDRTVIFEWFFSMFAMGYHRSVLSLRE